MADRVVEPVTARSILAQKSYTPLAESEAMADLGRRQLRLTAAAIHPGTVVRYHYRTGSSLATVTEKCDRFLTFVGEDCDGRFTHDQIDRLIDDGRLQVVLGASR